MFGFSLSTTLTHEAVRVRKVVGLPTYFLFRMSGETLSRHYGQNITLDRDRRGASKSLNNFDGALVFSESTLPNKVVFQFTVKSLNENWDGCLTFGVTSISPDRAGGVEAAIHLKHSTFIMCTQKEDEKYQTHLFIDSKRVLELNESMDLSSLGPGDTVGVMCQPNKLHFFVNDGTHLKIKLPPTLKIPEERYAVVDLYGSCSSIHKVEHIRYKALPKAARTSILECIIKEELLHDKKILPLYDSVPRTTQYIPEVQDSDLARLDKESLEEECEMSSERVSFASGMEQEHSGMDFKPVGMESERLLLGSRFKESVSLREGNDVSEDDEASGLSSARNQRVSVPMRSEQSLWERSGRCSYAELVKRFISSNHDHLGKKVAGYIDNKYNKCYCGDCSSARRDPQSKLQGPPSHGRSYSIPHGWFKLGLKLTFGPQIEEHDSFNRWHKAYHGTPLHKVQQILHSGGLVPTGSKSFGGKVVSPGMGHYTDENKPSGHTINRIFVSPSITYSSQDVFSEAYPYKDKETGHDYKVKVCFKVLINPTCYKRSPQTVNAPHHKEKIDPLFSNEELEWSTGSDREVYIYGLMIKLF